ncbi:MAG: hypothetical protein FJY82_12770 [Candidatus Aminicenantes bacterium]|nr:hypothetical protein [Candidatus Aminicenantes bacterium]
MNKMRGMGMAIAFMVLASILPIAAGRAGFGPISTWTIEGLRFVKDWVSCIDIIKLPSGVYRMYYTGSNISPLYPTLIQYAESPDGLIWEYKRPISINSSLPYPWWESSETMILPDGTFRMYLCYGYGHYAVSRQIYIASSTDGINWTLNSTPIIPLGPPGSPDDDGVTGPNFVDLGNGTYRMYYHAYDGANYRILSAFSTDGLNWTKDSGIRIDIGGLYDSSNVYTPRVLKLADGSFLMLYTGWGGTPKTSRILSAVSADGILWTKEDGVRIDPAELPGGLAAYPYGIHTGDIHPIDGLSRMYFSADQAPRNVYWGRVQAYSAVGTIESSPPVNNAPVAICQNVTVSADSSCSSQASVDNGSYDPDGDPLTITQTPAGPYPLGSTAVTLTVADDKGASSQCTATVTVVDETPPEIRLNFIDPVFPAVLWPPNHKMVEVTLNYTVTENCGPVTCTVAITSNEPAVSREKGDLSPDWEIVDSHHLRLRAERLGTGSGRIYTITVTCTDQAGNSATASVQVQVPHDVGK